MRGRVLLGVVAMVAVGCGGAPTTGLFSSPTDDGGGGSEDGGGGSDDAGGLHPDAAPQLTCLQASGVCSSGACPYSFVPAPALSCGEADMQCCITEDYPPDGGLTFPCGEASCFDCAGVACLTTEYCVAECTCGGAGGPGVICDNPPPECTSVAPWPGAKPGELLETACPAVVGR